MPGLVPKRLLKPRKRSWPRANKDPISPARSRYSTRARLPFTPTSTALKAQKVGLTPTDVFSTLQVYLGSQYVNDFNFLAEPIRCRSRQTENSGDPAGHHSPEGSQHIRRDGADRDGGADQEQNDPISSAALQSFSGRRGARGGGTGCRLRYGIASHGGACPSSSSQGHRI